MRTSKKAEESKQEANKQTASVVQAVMEHSQKLGSMGGNSGGGGAGMGSRGGGGAGIAGDGGMNFFQNMMSMMGNNVGGTPVSHPSGSAPDQGAAANDVNMPFFN